MTEKEIIGLNIRKYRKAAGHTQTELGKLIGSNKSCISAYEKGVNEVDMETLKKIADIYSITLDDMLGNTSTPDFTISNLCITENNINNALDTLFPIVSTDSAIQNDSFKTAYYKQMKLFEHQYRDE